ncbi:MAG: hypothetical protein A4E32_02146 [Methanomassiliicoccales archaeon PtaU1.Bin124]|nr:MAG: hypothetical protein A4E32_02146 [Methanomassiliicoccales archaeon PtaU1.Bin124]
MPVHLLRSGNPKAVKFLVVSQEPAFSWRAKGPGPAEERMIGLCRTAKEGSPVFKEAREVDPVVRLIQIFGTFDPTDGPVYWTHALKCIPRNGDRDVNKEWRKCAKACQVHLMNEIWALGGESLNVMAVGKYALEMCLNAFDDQDIDQELSISEFMQASSLPLSFKLRSKDGAVKNITLFVYTNPSSEVCKVKKVGGKMTVEELQELETKKVRDILAKKSL